MKTQELSTKKMTKTLVDKTLNKYEDVVLFPQKLAQANKTLRLIGAEKIKKAIKANQA